MINCCGQDFSYPNKNNKLAKTYAGVAVEPQKIVAGTTLPKDFDEFWNNELTKLRSEALEIKETKVSSKLLPKNIEAFDVFIKRGDIIATAFVAYPKNAKTKSLSGCLTFLGASKVNAELPVALFYAKKFNCIAINVNFHGLENHYPVDKDKLKTIVKRFISKNMEELKLGVVETRFADIIWQNEPIPSGELVKICEKELSWKKPTTYTVLRKLCERGIFQNQDSVVTSLISREEYYAKWSEQFVEETFKGSFPAFLAAFSSRKKLSEKDIAELEKLIRDSRR